MNIRLSVSKSIMAVISLVLLSGCAGMQTRTKSSVVDYLYPKKSTVVIEPSIPTLDLDLILTKVSR